MTCYRISLAGIPKPDARSTYILSNRTKAEARLNYPVSSVIVGLGVGLDEAKLNKAGLLVRRQDRPTGLQYAVDLVGNGD